VVARLKYTPADDVCCVVRALVDQGLFPHIRVNRVMCLASWGASTRAIARIHGVSSAWIAAGMEPGYVIEVIGERFYKLDLPERIKTIIHELLHIPYTFSGGLRPHGRLVNGRVVYSIYRKVDFKRLKKCFTR
jgi:predicted metallopeptidase